MLSNFMRFYVITTTKVAIYHNKNILPKIKKLFELIVSIDVQNATPINFKDYKNLVFTPSVHKVKYLNRFNYVQPNEKLFKFIFK